MKSQATHSRDDAGSLDNPRGQLPVQGKLNLNIRLALAAAAGAAMILLISRLLSESPSGEMPVLSLSGRIEGDETHISAGMPGRVNDVLVSEGDRVHKGQLILRLDDKDLKAKYKKAKSSLLAAEALKTQAQSAVALARDMAAASRARVNALESVERQLQQKSPGVLGHLTGGAGKLKKAREKVQMELAEAKQQLMVARLELDKAIASKDEAGAGVSQASAARDEVNADAGYFKITSPINGYCLVRNVQPGDLVAPGPILLILVDLNSVYLKGFIPEGSIAKVKIGQPAAVYLDSMPGKPLTGKIVSIDEQASFTPENVYFKQDRVKEVFGIKVAVDNAQGFAKPGMPADAQIYLGKEQAK